MASQGGATSRAELGNVDAWERSRVDRIIPSRAAESMQRESLESLAALLPLEKAPGRAYVAVIVDGGLNRIFVVRGGQEFYLWDGTDLLACALVGGFFSWSKNYFSAPASPNGVEGAIRRFINEIDDARLAESERTVSRVDLRHAAPFPFFTANSAGGSQPGSPSIDGIALSDGLLRLDLASPGRRYGASFWINLSSRQLIRSVVDGKETNLKVW